MKKLEITDPKYLLQCVVSVVHLQVGRWEHHDLKNSKFLIIPVFENPPHLRASIRTLPSSCATPPANASAMRRYVPRFTGVPAQSGPRTPMEGFSGDPGAECLSLYDLETGEECSERAKKNSRTNPKAFGREVTQTWQAEKPGSKPSPSHRTRRVRCNHGITGAVSCRVSCCASPWACSRSA